MSGLLGFLSNLLPFKDGGAIPPSNAMQRAGPSLDSWVQGKPKKLERLAKPSGMLPLPADFTFLGKRIIRPVPKKQGGAIPNFFYKTPKMPNPPYMPSLFGLPGTKPVPNKKGGAVKRKAKPKKAKK